MSILGFFREDKDFEVKVQCKDEKGRSLGTRTITISAGNSSKAMHKARGIARQDSSVFSAYAMEVNEIQYVD